MSFAFPAGLLGLAVVPLLFLLHLLRFRRRQVAAGSLLLWRRVAEGLPPRRSPLVEWRLSLLLQLAAGALAACAVAGPRLVSRRPAAVPLVLLLDRSASMAARPAGGDSALERAAAAANRALEAAGDDAPVTLAFDPPGEFARRFFGAGPAARTQARAALAALEAAPEGGDLAAAAQGALRRGGRLLVISDAAGPAAGWREHLPPGAAAELVAVGRPGENLALEAFEVAALPPGAPGGTHEVFAAARNLSPRRATAALVVTWGRGGEAGGSGRLSLALPPGARREAFLRADLSRADELEAVLSSGGDLALDDRAGALCQPPGETLVFVAGEEEKCRALRRALAACPGVRQERVGVQAALQPRLPCRLFICHEAIPPRVPEGVVVFIRPARAVAGLALADLRPVSGQLDLVGRGEPLLEGIAAFALDRQLVPGVELPGWRVLARAGGVPVIARQTTSSGQLIYLGLDPEIWGRSRQGFLYFPVFWANVLRAAGGLLAEDRRFARDIAGREIALPWTGGAPLLEDPAGARASLAPDAGWVRFVPRQLGIWRLAGGGDERRFRVDFLDPAESLLDGRSGPEPPAPPPVYREESRDFSCWFLVAALGALLLCWRSRERD